MFDSARKEKGWRGGRRHINFRPLKGVTGFCYLKNLKKKKKDARKYKVGVLKPEITML